MTTRASRVVTLAPNAASDDRALGELNTLLDRHCNTGSPDQMGYFLYNVMKTSGVASRIPRTCAFEPAYERDRKTGAQKLRTDKAILLKLWRKTKVHAREAELVLRIKDLNKRISYLEQKTDADGRMRTSVNIAGTETERHTASQTAMDTGGNLHTTPAGHKALFLPDPGYEFFSLDLSGADGWTIACECAVLGDTTMLDDLRFGLKPAQLVALLYQHGSVANTWTRSELKAKLPGIKDPPWLYLACKRVIWGTCYGMGELKMSEQILEDSFDPDGGATPVYVEPKTCRALQTLVHARYPGIRRRQERIRMLLARDGYLEFANGSRRTFFGRKDDNATLREAYGAHPQVVTTWVTSLGWHRLWFDRENRSDGREPIVQPLFLVHDSLIGQWPIVQRDWAIPKLRAWFDNPITIAGTTVTIPYSGHYGPSWAHAGEVDGYPSLGSI